MGRPRQQARRPAHRGLGCLIGVALLATPMLALAAGPADLFYERTVMTVADQRCGLFAPEVGAALAAGRAQARGAALRAGVSDAVLRQVDARARSKVQAAGCASPDLATAAARVRTAFEGYAKLSRMTYPGDAAEWRAARAGPVETFSWRLSQQVRFGADQLTFGMVGRGGQRALMAVATFADGATPYSARLVLRDPSRAPTAYLRGQALATRMAPRSAAQVFTAESRSPSGRDLSGRDAKTPGWAFRFPSAAIDALAGDLDPREAAAVEFLIAGPGGRDQVRTAYLEVGDFAAGRAFVMAAR